LLDLGFDLLADAIAFLLEQPDLALDLALDDGLPELEEANLPSDLFLKLLQGRKRHCIPLDKFLTFLEHQDAKDQRGAGRAEPGQAGPRQNKYLKPIGWRPFQLILTNGLIVP